MPTRRHWLASLSSLTLAACGGGGGSAPPPAEPAPALRLSSDRSQYFVGEQAELRVEFPRGSARLEPGFGAVHSGQLLRTGPYHPALKKRILGSHGHLSNAAAGDLLGRCLHDGLKLVAAAHLSEHNNRPDLARAALARVLDADGPHLRIADPALGLDWMALA